MNIFVGSFKIKMCCDFKEVFPRALVAQVRSKEFYYVYSGYFFFLKNKASEHHRALLFSGILKFSFHASKQFSGRKSFLVVQSWTGKLEASVKI